MQSDNNTAARQLVLCWVIIPLSAVGWPLILILGTYEIKGSAHSSWMRSAINGISAEVWQFWTNTLKWQSFDFLRLVPLGVLCRSLIFTARACNAHLASFPGAEGTRLMRALCYRYTKNADCLVLRLHFALCTRFLPGPKDKLPEHVPGADPGVTTPPPACIIQFVVC